jgi:hypothetical protein
MTKATKYFCQARTAAFMCRCGGLRSIWVETPYPDHNLTTLYECVKCRAVVSLADIDGDEKYIQLLDVPEAA